jgi:hypothetical protein
MTKSTARTAPLRCRSIATKTGSKRVATFSACRKSFGHNGILTLTICPNQTNSQTNSQVAAVIVAPSLL